MSLLQCDECKNTLKDPIFIPCGYSICKSHIDEWISNKTACTFCNKIHKDSFVVNQKVSRLLEILDRTKSSLTKLTDETKAYEGLKQRQTEFVNSRLDELKRQVEQEGDKIVEFFRRQADSKTSRCVTEIENHRETCLNRLDVKPFSSDEFFLDNSDINAKLANFNELLISDKISEDNWDDINEQTNLMNDEVTAKITALESSYMYKAVYRFESAFDYSKKIAFGRLMVEQSKNNGVQNQTDNSISISTTSQQDKSTSQPNTSQQEKANNESLKLPISSSTTTAATNQQQIATSLNNVRRFKRIFGHFNYVYCICFDRTGEYIFTCSDDKLVKMWRAKDGMLVYTLRGHTREICDLDINYENTILASGANDKKVMCWNVKTAKLIYINTHSESVSTVKFSPYCQDNIRWLISTDNDGLLSFLKYTNYDFDSPFDFKVSSKIVCSSFSTGGNFLAIGTIDKQIILFYILKTHPILIAKFPGHRLEVNSISFSNKSTCFLSGSKDGTVKVWNIKQKIWTCSLIELEPEQNLTDCNKAVWNCDDSLVITAQRTNKGGEQHCIKIWTPRGALKHVLNFHKRIIYIVKPHPTDPKLLLSASRDGYVVLWDIFTGQMLFTDYNKIGNEGRHGAICDVKWSPRNGELFASTDSHGHLSIFGFGASIPESYSSTPSQLFFHTDYDPLCESKEQKSTLVDKRTKIAPNLMPYGYLTDYMFNPMPLNIQRLVPTHESLTKEEFEKLIVPKPNGKFVINDRLTEINISDNLTHKNLIQPLSEALLRESEAIRLECSAKEEDVFKAEFDLLKDSDMNANKRRERIHSAENKDSSLESIPKPSKRNRTCQDDL